MSFSQRQMFGGSITCDIPTVWRDVSNVRQVPDHQEVYQSISNDPNMPGPCLVVEILEHQDQCSNSEAAAYFFEDLASANGVTSPHDKKFMAVPLPVSPTLPNNAKACSGIGTQKISPGLDKNVGGNPRSRNPRWVTVELCVLRLPDVGTDLLITLSQPTDHSDEAESASFSQTFLRAVQTFQVRDWKLFC
jgi:Ran-interacting Mog1 protein